MSKNIFGSIVPSFLHEKSFWSGVMYLFKFKLFVTYLLACQCQIIFLYLIYISNKYLFSTESCINKKLL